MAELQTFSYLNEEGELKNEVFNLIPDEALVLGYKTMLLTRHVDERMITLQRQGTISFALSSYGEEACSVATAHALESDDWIYPQYRETGVFFWRGVTIQDYVHHMFGNRDDLVKGRQMPNHYGSKEINVVTVSSPIGTKIPHAAGAAYAMKLQKEKNVVLCFFGEGASSEGDFHAGLSFAAVRSAPVIFFCRNNGYAISTPVNKQFSSNGVAPQGPAHGIKTFRIDGNDYFAIYETVKKARMHCLEGKGSVLIEAMTYRLGAHSTSDDPTRYREDKEVEKYLRKEPVKRLRLYLESKGLWNHNKEDAFLGEVKKNTDEAIKNAKETPHPELRTLVEDVYKKVPENLERQYQDLKQSLSKESSYD